MRRTLAVTLLAILVAAPLVAPASAEGHTYHVRLPFLVDTVTVSAADPRGPEARAQWPDAARGLFEGTLDVSGARVRLVATPTETLGLLVLEGVPHWVRVEEGVLVSAASPEAIVPPHEVQLFPDEVEAQGGMPAADNDNVLRVRVIADHRLWQNEGDAWAQHATQMMFLTEWIYWAHFGITFDAQYAVWKSPDPYGSPSLMCGGTGTYIRNVREHEEKVNPVATKWHDVLHVLTARTFTDAVGCAYVGAVDTSWAYSITQVNDVGADDLKRNVLIMAHEIGHNFAGTHERAAPTPGGPLSTAACFAVPVTILWPGCQTLEPPVFSDGRGASTATLASTGVMRDGGNVPWMKAYADPRV